MSFKSAYEKQRFACEKAIIQSCGSQPLWRVVPEKQATQSDFLLRVLFEKVFFIEQNYAVIHQRKHRFEGNIIWCRRGMFSLLSYPVNHLAVSWERADLVNWSFKVKGQMVNLFEMVILEPHSLNVEVNKVSAV